MIKLLYANGCSLTEGAELGNVQFDYDEKKYGANTHRTMSHLTDEHRNHIETHAYPYLLKEKLGIENYFNNATGGSSNKRIHRLVIEDIEQLCKTYDPSEIFVVIGWSSADRMEIYQNAHYSQIVPAYIPPQFSKSEKKFLELYDEHMNGCLVDLLVKHMLDLLAIKHYLEVKGVKYLFSYGLCTFFESDFSQEEISSALFQYGALKGFIDAVDFRTWAREDHIRFSEDYETFILKLSNMSFYSFIKLNNFKVGNGLHPLEDGHAAWAEVLYKYIQDHNILESK